MTEHRVRDDEVPHDAGTARSDSVPIPSASVIVLRNDPMEVLLLRRNESSSFVPGAWVFPGGAVDAADRVAAEPFENEDALAALKLCALRELFEEAGIWLGDPIPDAGTWRRRLLEGGSPELLFASFGPRLDALVLTSRWITPLGVPKRFDTCFFLTRITRDVDATFEHGEAIDLLWLSPQEALARHRDGTLPMVFPTIRNLEAIGGFADAEPLIESRRGAVVRPVQPRIVIEGGRKTIVLDEA